MVQNILVHLFWKNVRCGTFYLKSWVNVSVLSLDVCFQINRGRRCKYLSLSHLHTVSLFAEERKKKRDDVICFHPPQNITASQHLRDLSSYFIRHAGACCLLQTNTASRVKSPTGVRFRSDTRHFDVLHLPAMFDRSPFPNWGATTGKWNPQKNEILTKQQRLSVLFSLLQNTALNSQVQDEVYNMLFMTSKEIIRQRWHSLLPNLIGMTGAQTQLIGTYPKISYSL